MPELPEVETIKNDLQKYIIGKRIKEIEIKSDFRKKILPSAKIFTNRLRNRKIRSISRRAKMLILNLGENTNFIAHLKMTGQFIYWRGIKKMPIAGGHPIMQFSEKPDRFNKVKFIFTDNSQLLFNDVRKFGYLKLVNDKELEVVISNYGIEPLKADFTFRRFDSILRSKSDWAIKKILLSQELIAGLGNIYADESCFASKIRGTRKAKNLTLAQRKKLFHSIKAIIKNAIKNRGTSVKNFIDCDGRPGDFVKFLKVYGRVGEKCFNCRKGIVKKIKFGGRSMSYCPICQK